MTAMVAAPDGSRIIVGGRFTTLNGSDAYGMGSVDATTGATLPWAANQRIRDAGTTGAITSLRTDGTQIYGTGYAFGAGSSFEGIFGAEPSTGAINFVNNCHGDTYDVFPLGPVVYSASHVHSCEWIGAFKNTNPWTQHYAPPSDLPDRDEHRAGPLRLGLPGLPSSSVLTWFPTLVQGSFTGQGQAGWSVAGNSSYVVMGGEFPYVNGAAQQGLTRFAASSIAPNKVGPTKSSVVAPTAISVVSGTARVSWAAAWDKDNTRLTYNLAPRRRPRRCSR